MSFSHEDSSLFVLGSEAGGVFKCSMTSRGPPLTSECKKRNPIQGGGEGEWVVGVGWGNLLGLEGPNYNQPSDTE